MAATSRRWRVCRARMQTQIGEGGFQFGAAEWLFEHGRSAAVKRQIAYGQAGNDHHRHLCQSAAFAYFLQKCPAIDAWQLKIQRNQAEGLPGAISRAASALAARRTVKPSASSSRRTRSAARSLSSTTSAMRSLG